MKDCSEIIQTLRKEIAIITNRSSEEIDPEKSLTENGIHSMGFMELIISVKRIYQLDLSIAGLGPQNIKSVRALAERIAEGTDGALA